MSKRIRPIFNHFKKYVFRGLLAIIPPALCIFVLHLLYVGIDQRVTGVIERFFGASIPGLGIILVFLILYLLGFIASNITGRKLFSLLEYIVRRIPLINTTYQVGKQLSTTLSLPEKQVFKRAVLVEYLKPGMWTVGFVTGTIVDKSQDNETLLKVYIPTPPLPTSGTMVLVRQTQTRDPGWTIEEAMKVVISGGIIGPDYVA
ncbi:MAG: DUF502 domain-containing protein [Acidobacteriota bacterium]|jgi:uncharacterized membrane protein